MTTSTRRAAIAPLLAMSLAAMGCGPGGEPEDALPDTTGGGSTGSVGGTSGGGAPNVPSQCDANAGEGDSVGDIAATWSLLDHLGQMVSLYDLCGKVIYFEEGSMW